MADTPVQTSDFAPEVRAESTENEIKAYKELIQKIIQEKPNKNKLEKLKREMAKKYKLSKYPRNSDILKSASDEDYNLVLPYLRIRNVRSLSGVNVISVFTAPFACRHGACIFCPGGPSWGTPMSYTGREPGAMRAISNGFDPISQIKSRIDQLQATGHNAEKLDIIVMGGTFNSTPAAYQDQFMLGVYEGMNDVSAKTIEEAKTQNETAKYRCIGLTFETKPDWSTKSHIRKMLEYGVTRVELGVQTLRDEVLKSTNRGHDLQETVDAFAALRDAGLKITAHMMPGLPGTTPEIDIEDFHTLYYDPRFIPDEMKIYPTQVIENTPLAEMVLSGEYKGLTNEETFRIMKEAKLMTPPFVRIKRALRDLPIPMVMDGPTWADMRARIQKDLDQVDAIKCRCIRCREIGMNYYKDPENFKLGEVKQVLRSYEASSGQEHFLSYEDENEILIGFVRLRYPSENIIFKGLENASILRELHVYGSALAIDDVNDPHIKQSFQHKGYGRKLLQWAEDMTLEAGYDNIAVISGVGVREYYRKFDYELDEFDRFYMVKKLI